MCVDIIASQCYVFVCWPWSSCRFKSKQSFLSVWIRLVNLSVVHSSSTEWNPRLEYETHANRSSGWKKEHHPINFVFESLTNKAKQSSWTNKKKLSEISVCLTQFMQTRNITRFIVKETEKNLPWSSLHFFFLCLFKSSFSSSLQENKIK